MLGTARAIPRLGVLLTILFSASSAISAQETGVVKERRLTPDFDFGLMQMPVEIVSIKLNGVDIVPGEPIKGDDDWLQGLSFRLKNISDKPIAFVNIGFKFPLRNGFVVSMLAYGINCRAGSTRTTTSPPAIAPGHDIDLALTGDNYKSFLYVLDQARAPRSFDKAPFYVDTVCFEGEPDVIWQTGFLKRRHAREFGRFDIIQKYFLPTKDN